MTILKYAPWANPYGSCGYKGRGYDGRFYVDIKCSIYEFYPELGKMYLPFKYDHATSLHKYEEVGTNGIVSNLKIHFSILSIEMVMDNSLGVLGKLSCRNIIFDKT